MENVFNKFDKNICNVHVENKIYAQKVSIQYFKEFALNHFELETICKKETVFYTLKNPSLRYKKDEKSDFFISLKKIKSVTLYEILSKASARKF